MELTEKEAGITSWEAQMRVNDNGRLKLCTYIIQIRGTDLCCFFFDRKKALNLGELKILHSLPSCEVKLIPPSA